MLKCTISLLGSLLIFLTSCSIENKEKINYTKTDLSKMSLEEILDVPITFSDKEYTLEKVKEINIPIDSVSENWSVYPIYYDADTVQYYVQGNEAINSIDFYDLDKKRLYKRVRFERTGNNMISSLNNFFIKNVDSIYIFESNKGSLVLTNIKGEILKRYLLPKKHFFDVIANMGANFYVKESKAYFCADIFSGMQLHEITEDYVKNQRTIGVFSFQKQSIEFIPPNAPLYLSDINIPATFLNSSYSFNNSIFVQQNNFTGVISYSANRENYNYAVLRHKSFDKDKAKEIRRESNGISYDNYFLILDNKKNNLFYSVILEGIDEKDINGKENSYEDKPITIVIADENFHHAGEITLPKDTHFRNIMVTKEGLLVSNANPKNPNNDEGVLSFTLYKPKQIK